MNINRIFNIHNFSDFEKLSLEIFQFQAKNNIVYGNFLNHLNIDIDSVQNIHQIPFLPIQFFKSHKIISAQGRVQQIFLSSGTNLNKQSRHFVSDLNLYKSSFRKGFEYFYGAITDYTVLALLPSYLERSDSSLVFMVNDLITKSGNPKSGFYLDDITALWETLLELDTDNQKTLLIGVSFALLDFVENFNLKLKNTIIMETGGMKGRRKEMIRDELHQQLRKGFGVTNIHSEYGMTELLSQAYSKEKGIFECPPWMKVIIREPEDALNLLPSGKSGGINVIDLANIYSCSFVATQDLGVCHADETFEVLGRFDDSDIRGCNLMVF